MALGDILAVPGIILLVAAIFAFGIVSLQCCFNECHRRRAQQQASSSSSSPSTQTQSALWLRGGSGGGSGSTTTQQTTTTRGQRGGDHDHPPEPPLLLLPAAAATAVYCYHGGMAPVRSDKKDDDAVEECLVCLAELQDGDEARFLPCCNHGLFHAQCVDTWLASRSTCPVCRIDVAPTAPAWRRRRWARGSPSPVPPTTPINNLDHDRVRPAVRAR